MEDEIGTAAGTIWQLLAEHGVQSVAKLKQRTKLSEPLLLMGLGWLAREGKLQIVRTKSTTQVSLREGGL